MYNNQLQEFLKSDHWLRRYCISSGGLFYFEPPCIVFECSVHCNCNKRYFMTDELMTSDQPHIHRTLLAGVTLLYEAVPNGDVKYEASPRGTWTPRVSRCQGPALAKAGLVPWENYVICQYDITQLWEVSQVPYDFYVGWHKYVYIHTDFRITD